MTVIPNVVLHYICCCFPGKCANGFLFMILLLLEWVWILDLVCIFARYWLVQPTCCFQTTDTVAAFEFWKNDHLFWFGFTIASFITSLRFGYVMDLYGEEGFRFSVCTAFQNFFEIVFYRQEFSELLPFGPISVTFCKENVLISERSIIPLWLRRDRKILVDDQVYMFPKYMGGFLIRPPNRFWSIIGCLLSNC